MEHHRSSPQLRLSLLGPPQVKQGQTLLIIQRRKAQALFFYLVVTGELHQRATLAALLWPEADQRQAQAALRRHLSELNRILGGGWLETGQDTVRLARPTDHWVDVHEFRRLLATCQVHELATDDSYARCIEPLTAAVTLYRADFLAGFTLPDAPAFDEWQSFQTEELRLAFATALERLAEALAHQGRTAEAIPYARRRLSLDPLHEPAHQQLMRYYAAAGQQSMALHQYEVCAQTLQAELDLPPSPETQVLYEQIRRGAFAAVVKAQAIASTTVRPPAQNLPAPTTPLIGRSAELTQLLHLGRNPARRLITILGPGGIGKSRLSLEMAGQLADEIPDGAFLVLLAQLSESAHMVPAIAAALGYQFQADGRATKHQLFAYLQEKQLLLVLDNFEHLMEGVTFVQELLENCPLVRLLVTSRARLNLTGETVFTLGSLDYPTSEASQPIQNYGAVQLFVETAHRVRPTEVFQPDDLEHVARICRMVGGMPLGVILAAARIELLSSAAIADELAQGFDLLETEMRDVPERQRSMRVVLAYSWQRLTIEERTVFMRLAVFRGGFTREAARAVAGASLSVLARLVDKSFVHRTAGDRYDIHELLRQYAEQELSAAGAYSDAQQAHNAYYLNFLSRCEVRMATPEQLQAIGQLEDDFENIRVAWQWAVSSHDYTWVDQALDGLFRWLWLRRARQHDALDLLRFAHQAWTPPSGQAPHPVWGRILARIVEQQGPWLLDTEAVQERVGQALALARQHGNLEEEVFCGWVLALVTVTEYRFTRREKDLQSAIQSYEACVAAYRAGGDPFWLAHTLEILGHALRQLDLYDRAVPVLEESLALRRAQGDRFGMARSLREIAWVRFKQGLERETLEAAEAAYRLQSELGDEQGIADSRFFLALSRLCCGDWPRARDLLDPVRHFAEERKNALYQKWVYRAFSIATCMAENMHRLQSATCSFPNHFDSFMTTLVHVLFSTEEFHMAYHQNVRKLFELAATDREMAVCLPFAADLLLRSGNRHRAGMILALAFGSAVVAEGWIGLHPEVRSLQQALRDSMSPDEFEHAWREGQNLDLHATVVELRDKF